MSQTPLLHANLTTILSIGALGVALTLSVPVVFPQLLHGFHVAHILLHAGGVILALFITTLAVIAYRRLRTRRLLLTTVAFANFVLTELLLLAYAITPKMFDLGETNVLEVGHLLTFVTLGLLALGVLRDD